MPIAFVASQLQVPTPSNFAGGSRQVAADDAAGGSFSRMLLNAAASPGPAAPPRPAPKPKAPSRTAASTSKSRAESKETQSEDASSHATHAKPKAKTAGQSDESEPTSQQADTKPADEGTEQKKDSGTSATSALAAVTQQIQEIQAQPQSEGAEAESKSPVAVVALGEAEAAKQAAESGDDASSPAETSSTAQANAPGSVATEATDLPATETFADGLDHAMKKLAPESDANPSAAASTNPGAMHPAMAAAGSGSIAQTQSSRQAAELPPAAATEQPFVQANQDSIVNGIRTQLLPGGGTMQIRLSPPELGAMQVKVEMRGDTLAATFQTSNDQAAQILTQNLGQLKQALEQQGVSVGRLQVVSAPRNDGARTGDNSGQSPMQWQGFQQQQSDQRREVLRQLWNRVAFGRDPIDVIA